MAEKTKKYDNKITKKGDDKKGDARTQSFKELGESASGIVQKAALILEEEIARGIVAASEAGKNINEKGSVSPDQFNEVAQRLRKDAHNIINILSDRVNEGQTGKFDDLSKRFQKDAHDAVDVMLNLVNIAPDVINRLAGKQNPGKKTDNREKTGKAKTGKQKK